MFLHFHFPSCDSYVIHPLLLGHFFPPHAREMVSLGTWLGLGLGRNRSRCCAFTPGHGGVKSSPSCCPWPAGTWQQQADCKAEHSTSLLCRVKGTLPTEGHLPGSLLFTASWCDVDAWRWHRPVSSWCGWEHFPENEQIKLVRG